MARTKKPANAIEARELSLYTTNESALYERHALPIIANLRRKIAKDTYDARLALKLWRVLADIGATSYRREFKMTGGFSPATRDLAAAEIADHYADLLREPADA